MIAANLIRAVQAEHRRDETWCQYVIQKARFEGLAAQTANQMSRSTVQSIALRILHRILASWREEAIQLCIANWCLNVGAQRKLDTRALYLAYVSPLRHHSTTTACRQSNQTEQILRPARQHIEPTRHHDRTPRPTTLYITHSHTHTEPTTPYTTPYAEPTTPYTTPSTEPITPYAEPTTPYTTPYAEPKTPYAEPTTPYTAPTGPHSQAIMAAAEVLAQAKAAAAQARAQQLAAEALEQTVLSERQLQKMILAERESLLLSETQQLARPERKRLLRRERQQQESAEFQ